MELKEALELIEVQKKALDDNAEAIKQFTEASSEHEKALQAADNKGFDRATNKLTADYEGYLSKDEIAEQLKKSGEEHESAMLKQKQDYKRRGILSGLGIKNPKSALKLIADDDIESMLADDFDSAAFTDKYSDDIVFKTGTKTPDVIKPNNSSISKPKTSDDFGKLSQTERGKLSTAELSAML